MLINDKLVYIELQKTGCTHTRNILEKIPNNNTKIIGKHNTYDAVSSEVLGDFKHKTKIGNIRNPWDWYVSLWAFGCMKKGDLYHTVTLNPKLFSISGLKAIAKRIYRKQPVFSNSEQWVKAYSDNENPENFRSWLKLILAGKNMSIGEGYKESEISSAIGLLTFRYLKLYTYNGKKLISKIKDFDSVLKYDKENNFIDVIIKNESIHNDLLDNVNLLGCDEATFKTILEKFQSRTNKSIRSDYQKYYDTETIALVKEKDKLIIDKYNYVF